MRTRWAPAVLVLVACGARSTLDPAEETSNEGGASGSGSTSASASTSSATTSGGAGGGPPCELLVSGEPLGFEDVWSKNPAFWPRLTQVGDGRDRVAVVYRWDPIDEGISLADVALMPWGEWNREMFDEPWGINTQDGGEHVVASAPDERIAVLTGRDNGMASFYVIRPSAPSFDSVALGSGQDVRALAVSRGESGHFVAFERMVGGQHVSTIGTVSAGAWTQELDGAACATAPLSADAIPVVGGYLVALSTGRPLGSCFDANGMGGPPEDMLVARIDGAIEVNSLVSGAPITFLGVEPRPEGAWIVVRREGRPLVWQQVDAEGYLVTGSEDFVDPAPASTIATTNAGAWLVASWVEADKGRIRIRVTDGERTFDDELPVEPGAEADGEVTALASEDGRYVLLAWSETPLGLLPRIRLARFELTAACHAP